MTERIKKLDSFIEMNDVELMKVNGGAAVGPLIKIIIEKFGEWVGNEVLNEYRTGKKSYAIVKAIADGTYNYNHTYC